MCCRVLEPSVHEHCGEVARHSPHKVQDDQAVLAPAERDRERQRMLLHRLPDAVLGLRLLGGEVMLVRPDNGSRPGLLAWDVGSALAKSLTLIPLSDVVGTVRRSPWPTRTR